MSLSIYVLIYMRCSLESRTHIHAREPNLPVVLREGSQLPLTQARCAQSFEREKQRTQAQLGSARLDAIDSRNDLKKINKNRLKLDSSRSEFEICRCATQSLAAQVVIETGIVTVGVTVAAKIRKNLLDLSTVRDLCLAKNSERSNQV